MAETRIPIMRRRLLQGLGVGWLAQFLSTPAKADCAPRASAAVGDTSDIWSNEYWAKKGEVSLYMFRKRLGAPQPGEPPRPVLFCVHGSSNSARTSFDMTVPGVGEYSMMNVFAKYGFDVWTLDHEGYGSSSRTSGNSDIASGVEDLKAGVELVVRETGVQKMHFMGVSSGALRAAAYAMARPERCDRLVLCAMSYKGTGAPTLANRAEQIEYYRKNNTRPRGRIDIERLFTRDSKASPIRGSPRRARTAISSSATGCRAAPISTWWPTCRWSIPRRSCRRSCWCAASTTASPRSRTLRLLQSASQRRPPDDHPAGHRAFGSACLQSGTVLARGPQLPDHAGPDRVTRVMTCRFSLVMRCQRLAAASGSRCWRHRLGRRPRHPQRGSGAPGASSRCRRCSPRRPAIA